MSFDKPKKMDFDASGLSFGIAVARFNQELTGALLGDVLATLTCAGVSMDNIKIVHVPGSGELPHMCNLLATIDELDAIIALGVVIAGETPHHMIIGESTAVALQNVALATEVPVINGIVVTNDRAQAEARTTGSIRRGVEFGEAALEMACLTKSFLSEYEEIGEDGEE
jgi:6,7-dimethyl-8-ribityllumazine synthase